MTACRSRTGANINILTKGFMLQHTHTRCTGFGASGRSGCATQLGDFICSRLTAPHFSGAELGLVQPQSPAPPRASMLHTHLKRFQWQFQISAALPDIAATFSNAYLTSLCVVIVNQHCCTPIRLSVSPLGPPPSPLSHSVVLQLRLQLRWVYSTRLQFARFLLLNKVAFAAVNCHLCVASPCLCLCLCLFLCLFSGLPFCLSVAGLSMWKNRFQLAVPVPERTNLPATLANSPNSAQNPSPIGVCCWA